MIRSPLLREITDDETDAFAEDGVVCLRGLFSHRWIDDLRAAAEYCLNSPGALHAELAAERGDNGRFFHDTFIWTRNQSCRRFVFEFPAAS